MGILKTNSKQIKHRKYWIQLGKNWADNKGIERRKKPWMINFSSRKTRIIGNSHYCVNISKKILVKFTHNISHEAARNVPKQEKLQTVTRQTGFSQLAASVFYCQYEWKVCPKIIFNIFSHWKFSLNSLSQIYDLSPHF